MADSELPDWADEAIGKVAFLFVVLGVGGVLLGVVFCFTGQLDKGLPIVGCGALVLVGGIGLYAERTWALILALLLCLGGLGFLGARLVSAAEAGKERELDKVIPLVLGFGCPLLVGALGLILVLVRSGFKRNRD